MAEGKFSDEEQKILTCLDSVDDETEEFVKEAVKESLEKLGQLSEDVEGFLDKISPKEEKKIGLETFCSKVGIPKKDALKIKETRKKEKEADPIVLPEGIELVSHSMTMTEVKLISQELVTTFDKEGAKELSKIVGAMKAFLDLQFGKIWHAVLIEGSYSIHYCHEPFKAVHMKYEGFSFLCWRTPKV